MHEDDDAYLGAGVLTVGLVALICLVLIGFTIAAVW